MNVRSELCFGHLEVKLDKGASELACSLLVACM